MRNNRGEWDYREPYDKDNYAFIRRSGIKSWEFEEKHSVAHEVMWLGIALAFTVVVSCLIAFVFLLVVTGR